MGPIVPKAVASRRLVLEIALLLVGFSPLARADDPAKPHYPGVITGRVLDREGGTGLPGVEVSGFNPHGGGQVYAKSGADGDWRMENVPSGVYPLRINSGVGRASDCVEVRVLRNEVRAPDLLREHEQWISGTVREFGTGKEVRGVWIFYSSPDGNRVSVNTDQAGKYRIDLRPNQFTLSVSPPSAYSLCGSQGQPLYGDQSRPYKILPGIPVENANWTVCLNPSFHGRVIMPDGAPVPKVNVYVEALFTPIDAERKKQLKLMNSGTASFVRGEELQHAYQGGDVWPRGDHVKAWTDAEGVFTGPLTIYGNRADVVPSILDVIAAKPDYSLVGVAPSDSIDVTLGLPGSVKFRLPEETGEYPPVDKLWITDPSNSSREHHGHAGKHLGNGEYQFDKLIPGLWYVLRQQNHAPSAFTRYQVKAGEVLDLGVLTRDVPPRRSQDELLGLLAAQESDKQQSAFRELQRMGAQAAFAVPALIAELDDPASPNKGGEAADTLGKIGPAAAAAVPRLMEIVLAVDNRMPPLWAVEALGEIGDHRTLPALKRSLLLATGTSEQEVALRALSRFPAGDVIPTLTRALSVKLVSKSGVCKLLGTYGPAAKEAVPALLELLPVNKNERYAVAEALGRIGDPAALPALHELAKEELDGQEFSRVAKAIDEIYTHMEESAAGGK